MDEQQYYHAAETQHHEHCHDAYGSYGYIYDYQNTPYSHNDAPIPHSVLPTMRQITPTLPPTSNASTLLPLATNPHEILQRIESLILGTLHRLSDNDDEDNEWPPQLPILIYPSTSSKKNATTKNFTNISQSRSVSNTFLILKLIHTLLTCTIRAQERRRALLQQNNDGQAAQQPGGLYAHSYTVTTRQVYYYYVTHFKNQKECDTTITDVSRLLRECVHDI